MVTGRGMESRRKQLFGPPADDADARGDHRYPGDETEPGAVEQGETALTREPGGYAAGADGTQRIHPPLRR